MSKKYEFTGETKEHLGCILYRIRAVVSFANVEEGDVGGWIETEENLSHRGNAWIKDDACVYGKATVYGDAKVSGKATVYGDAKVFGKAKVRGNANVYGNAKVYGKVIVDGEADVCGNANVFHKASFMVFKNCWSSMRWFTYTRSNRMWSVGCFHGSGKELVEKAYADSETSGRCYEAIVHAMETIEAAIAKDGLH